MSTENSRIVGVFGMRFEINSDETLRDKRPNFSNPTAVAAAMSTVMGSGIDGIVVGGSKGIERLVEAWAKQTGIPVTRVRPETNDGDEPGASFAVRNNLIIKQSTEIVLLWDGRERGLETIPRIAVVLDKPIRILPIQNYVGG